MLQKVNGTEAAARLPPLVQLRRKGGRTEDAAPHHGLEKDGLPGIIQKWLRLQHAASIA